MKTIFVVLIVVLFLAILFGRKKEGFTGINRPFLIPVFHSPINDLGPTPFMLEDPSSPYKRFSTVPQLSGENYSDVAAYYAPYYNNSDIAVSQRGWKFPTEGSCTPNELCGKFYGKLLTRR